MDIKLLHITECPSWQICLRNLRHALIELYIGEPIQVTLLDSSNLDQFASFAGSPTILFDGKDLFSASDTEGELACRVYEGPTGMRGYPTTEEIIEAIRGRMAS